MRSIRFFTSSDDESLSDEDVSEDNMKIYSNPLFEFDDKYISSDVNPLFDEVLEDIECKDSYDSNLDESTFLVTPLLDSNEDECFTPSDDVEFLLHRDPSTPMIRGDIDEIDAFLDIDIPTNIKDGFYDSEGDVLYLKSLLSDDTTPNSPPEVTDIAQKDKNKAKRTKPSTRMERARKTKAKGPRWQSLEILLVERTWRDPRAWIDVCYDWRDRIEDGRASQGLEAS
ncbi:hypothetical protein Tco_0906124 [Tanacetum coccineum]